MHITTIPAGGRCASLRRNSSDPMAEPVTLKDYFVSFPKPKRRNAVQRILQAYDAVSYKGLLSSPTVPQDDILELGKKVVDNTQLGIYVALPGHYQYLHY
jgi:hypothetical protein